MQGMQKNGVAFSDYDASMKVRVVKANGEVIEMQGNEVVVDVTEELETLIKEYKSLTKRAKEIELILLSKMIGE